MGSIVMVVMEMYRDSRHSTKTQYFYAESQLLMNRISEVIRENTIDYDRYFLESGPACGGFDARQIETSRYPDIFYWDINSDNKLDRNLLGAKPDGSEDACSRAWHTDSGKIVNNASEPLPLYMINGSRDKRFSLKWEETQKTLLLATEIGTDTDGDGEAETWSFMKDSGAGLRIDTNKVCVYDDGAGNQTRILGEASAENCISSHGPMEISLPEMEVSDFSYRLTPDRDPFLATRIDPAMIHPLVRLRLNLVMRDPKSQGFSETTRPEISLQTAISSRIYGNTRR